jgi:hypothetical protein
MIKINITLVSCLGNSQGPVLLMCVAGCIALALLAVRHFASRNQNLFVNPNFPGRRGRAVSRLVCRFSGRHLELLRRSTCQQGRALASKLLQSYFRCTVQADSMLILILIRFTGMRLFRFLCNT